MGRGKGTVALSGRVNDKVRLPLERKEPGADGKSDKEDVDPCELVRV